MKTKAAILGAIALVAIFAGSCSAAMGSPKQTTIGVGYDEFASAKSISKEVTITQGSELIVSLAANPSTGYGWTKAAIGAPGVLSEADSKYVAPETNRPGTGGTQVWTFKASGAGTTTVKTEYSQPWEGGQKAEWTFVLTVTVQ